MRTAIVTVLCVGFLMNGVARAQVKKGEYAKDIEAKQWANVDEAISLHELRGMVVVLFFWVSWHEGGEYIAPLMNIINARIGKTRGVYTIGLTDAERSRVKDMIEKEKIVFPIGFESKSYEEYGITMFPYVVIVDANGKIYWGGRPGEKDGETLVREILGCLAETPPTKTHPEEALKAKAYLSEAREALREDKYQQAFQKAKDAFGHALTGDALKTLCQDMLDLVDALGRDKLAQADRALDENRFEDSVSLLREIIREFKGTDGAKSAKNKLNLLKKKNPKVKELIEKEESLGAAENLLAAAIDSIRDSEFGEAYEKLEQIVNEYGSTKTTEKAQTLLERMRKNEAVMLYVGDHLAAPECNSWLSRGRAFKRIGQFNRSREMFQMVIDKYPDTIHADEAAKELADLP